uniref:Uncharacterized protein n=1 Tax=Setaria viridis TaxID=4556 RepID=A0A4U6V5G4_SETVI|nr:hypothetical protein SEVIR_3G050050v2 [Setaria viridis]
MKIFCRDNNSCVPFAPSPTGSRSHYTVSDPNKIATKPQKQNHTISK